MDKHKSKLHKGFGKMVKRQDSKPSDAEIQLPIAIQLPKNFKGDYNHYFTVSNNKWNGMNLKVIYNSFTVLRVGGMYGKFSINKQGKYTLSMYGRRLLKKRKDKLLTPLTTNI